MPTALKNRVTRLTESTVRDGTKRRRLVVTLYPGENPVIGLRPEKTRREELVDPATVWQLAVRLRVQQERGARKAARKSGRR